MSEPLPAGPYDLLLADPPWARKAAGFGHMTRHYATLKPAAIEALPVGAVAADDAVLLLWTVWSHYPDALRVIAAWGFEYRTLAWLWIKTTAAAEPTFRLGYYSRGAAEPCLIATRGRGLARRVPGVPQILTSRPREHSRKPDGQYDHIDRLFGTDVRRLELFARRRWPGWDAWGLEAPAEEAVMLRLDHAS